LFHRETVFVTTTGDFKDVAFPIITKAVTFDLVGDTFVAERADCTFIFNVDTEF
jgi:hypothetical protein